MKKRTFLAGAIAAAMVGGMMPAAPQSAQTTSAPQQMNRANQQNQTPQQQPITANEARSVSSVFAGIGDFVHIGANPRVSGRAKWCDMGGSGGYNKIKHGRNLRRKHRRA